MEAPLLTDGERVRVLEMVGIERSTLYAWVAQHAFPRPLRLGSRAVGWRDSDIHAWLASRKPTDEVG